MRVDDIFGKAFGYDGIITLIIRHTRRITAPAEYCILSDQTTSATSRG